MAATATMATSALSSFSFSRPWNCRISLPLASSMHRSVSATNASTPVSPCASSPCSCCRNVAMASLKEGTGRCSWPGRAKARCTRSHSQPSRSSSVAVDDSCSRADSVAAR